MRRVALADVLVVAAAFALLLALDVRTWENELRATDAQFAATPSAQVRWKAGERVPAGAARALLGIDDDLGVRRALSLVPPAARSGRELGAGLERQGARSAAQAALSDVAAHAAPRVASQATTLLGALALVSEGPADAGDYARDAFVRALELDAANDEAMYDLELLLRLLRAEGEREGSTAGPGQPRDGREGAGSSAEGGGY